MIRTSIGSGRTAPTGRISRSWIARSNLAWSASGTSAISSSSRVPPCAAPNRPSPSPRAPVKAPLRWPNRIASSIVSGKAAQLTAVNGTVRAGRGSMDVAGEAFLAGAGLAEQQHRAVAGRDPLGEIERGGAGRLAAARPRGGADQLGGQRIAEGEVVGAVAEEGGRGGGGADQRGRVALVDHQIAGPGGLDFIAGKDGGAGRPAAAGGEPAHAQARALQPCGQGGIGFCCLVAQTDHSASPRIGASKATPVPTAPRRGADKKKRNNRRSFDGATRRKTDALRLPRLKPPAGTPLMPFVARLGSTPGSRD